MADDAPFARDLGYLGRFLDELRVHAAGLPEPAGARLEALLDGEAARWTEIRALLGGGQAGAARSGPGGGTGRPGRSSAPAATPPEDGSGLTVGSLRRR